MAKIIIGLIAVIFLAGMSIGQNAPSDVPIVSDKVVERSDTLRIVDKDEQQRVARKLANRIQRLEDRVTALEAEIENLKD